jgi:hypothetical protein
MMKKQTLDEKKREHGYTMNPARCSTCQRFKFEEEKFKDYWGISRTKQTKKRCDILKCAVKSSAICNNYERDLFK